MSESFKFYCPHCDNRLTCGEDRLGHHASCPACQKWFTVPSLDVYRRIKSVPVAEKASAPKQTIKVLQNHTQTPAYSAGPKVPLNRNTQARIENAVSEFVANPANKHIVDMLVHNTPFAPRCPICNSTFLQEINAIAGVLLGGLSGASKRHVCMNCKHMF